MSHQLFKFLVTARDDELLEDADDGPLVLNRILQQNIVLRVRIAILQFCRHPLLVHVKTFHQLLKVLLSTIHICRLLIQIELTGLACGLIPLIVGDIGADLTSFRSVHSLFELCHLLREEHCLETFISVDVLLTQTEKELKAGLIDKTVLEECQKV